MIQSIAHAAVTVQNMEESIRFYTKALGFTKAFEIPNPQTGKPWIVYLCAGKGQFVELFYDGTVENPWNDTLIGFNHLCFAVEDIHAAAQQVKDAGYSLDVEPNEGCDHNWQAWTKDPNGVRIELMQMDPRSPHWKFL